MAWYYVVSIVALVLTFFAGVILSLKSAGNSPKIKTLLLDADGTLLDFDRSEQAALRETFEALCFPFDSRAYDVYHKNNDACWKALERGEITREELKVQRFRRTFEELGIDGDLVLATKTYEGNLSKHAFPFAGAEQTCRRLGKRYDLYIVTNGLKHVQAARMAKTEIPNLVKGIYISEDVGFAKPSPEFFDKIFADHPDLKRKETMIVGDSLSGDILGGNNAEIMTCWVNRNGQPRPEGLRIDVEISDVTELERVI
ncbi:MAG: YjjG family noncanonical pyrimidine nucleotidase [Clostridia bacterium]|nr:YjjG family noncanonical pyrimidine nucleotidase [Clostridia bacterium]